MYENPYYQPYWVTDDVLEHYGILGMKWGVRRTPEQLGHKPRTSTEKWKAKQLDAIDRLYNKSYKKLDKAYKEDPIDESIMKYKRELEAQQKKDRKKIESMSFVEVEAARDVQRAEAAEKRANAVKATGGALMWGARMTLLGVRIGGTVAVLNVLADAGRTAMDFVNSPEGQATLKAGSDVLIKFGNGELTAVNLFKEFVGVNAAGTKLDKALSTIDLTGVMPGDNYIPPEVLNTKLNSISADLTKVRR